MKNIAIDYHFVRGQVQKGALEVSHVNTRDQLADALKKLQLCVRFLELQNKIGVTSDTLSCGTCWRYDCDLRILRSQDPMF